METTVRTALQLGPGVHVVRVRHAAGGWFTLRPLTVSAAQAMAGAAGGQAGTVAAELGILAERTPTPTLLSVSPSPATVGDTLSISGIINTALGLGGAAAGAAAAQATPTVLERSPTPILSSVSPNPATVGDVLSISGSVDGQLAAAGAAAGQASAVATITVGRSLAGAAAGAGGANASELTVQPAGSGPLIPPNPGFEYSLSPSDWTASLNGNDPMQAAGRFASAIMTGAYVGRVVVTGVSGDGTVGDAEVYHSFTRAEIDATAGDVTFDARITGISGSAYAWMNVVARDAGGASLMGSVSRLALYNPTAASDSSTVLPLANTTYTRTFNLKSWVSSRLAAGKTWADVANVKFGLHCWADDGSITAYVDNFR